VSASKWIGVEVSGKTQGKLFQGAKVSIMPSMPLPLKLINEKSASKSVPFRKVMMP
jgi:hypothetical protein